MNNDIDFIITAALSMVVVGLAILYSVWNEDKNSGSLTDCNCDHQPSPPATDQFSAPLRSDADAARIKALEAEASTLCTAYTRFRANMAAELGLTGVSPLNDDMLLDTAMKIKAQHDDFIGRLGVALQPAAAPDAYQDGAEAGILKTVERLVAEMGHSAPCPCTLTTPCHPRCTCVNGASSLGCSRCASYGSKEQQAAAAKKLAEWIDAGRERERRQ